MDGLELIASEVDSIEQLLSRRAFLSYLATAAAASRLNLSQDDKEFLRKVAATLLPAEAIARTKIDVISNIEHLLSRGSADHRAKVLRLISWAQRVSFLYGGEQVAIRGRNSRFKLIRKMSKALSSLCLVAFWGDERALELIPQPSSL